MLSSLNVGLITPIFTQDCYVPQRRGDIFFGADPVYSILRKAIEGYLDSVPSLIFNKIKTKLIMHAFHSSRYLQSKKSRFSDLSTVNVQMMQPSILKSHKH